MEKITTDGFTFEFPNAKEVYEFDCEFKSEEHYHGFKEMKAVDIIAEFDNVCLFIEVKDFYNPKCDSDTIPRPKLQNDLKYKVRDSFLYQFCHEKENKPIFYICLLEHLDAATMLQLSSNLGKVIPDANHLPDGWSKSFIDSVFVVDKDKWNKNLSLWGTVNERNVR